MTHLVRTHPQLAAALMIAVGLAAEWLLIGALPL